MYPDKTEQLCRALAARCARPGSGGSTSIVSPAVGGIVPGYETARQLGVPAVWVEREDGEFRLRRFEMPAGARVAHRRGHRHDRAVDPRDDRRGAGARRRGGRLRLPDRPLGRRGRCRGALGRAGALQGSGLCSRPDPAGNGGHPAGQARQPRIEPERRHAFSPSRPTVSRIERLRIALWPQHRLAASLSLFQEAGPAPERLAARHRARLRHRHRSPPSRRFSASTSSSASPSRSSSAATSSRRCSAPRSAIR